MSEAPTIVLVPGMYSPRFVMMPLATKLRRQGFKTHIFRNRFFSQSPPDNASRLLKELQSIPSEAVHLVGHSLGGVVIMHTLNSNATLTPSEQFAPGRVVLMASPIGGSDLAMRLYARRWLRPLLGRSVVDGVLDTAPNNLNGREIGVISGSARSGLAAAFYRPDQTNDGVVNQSETQLVAASDALSVPQSHAMMVFSEFTAMNVARFLKHGRFVD